MKYLIIIQLILFIPFISWGQDKKISDTAAFLGILAHNSNIYDKPQIGMGIKTILLNEKTILPIIRYLGSADKVFPKYKWWEILYKKEKWYIYDDDFEIEDAKKIYLQARIDSGADDRLSKAIKLDEKLNQLDSLLKVYNSEIKEKDSINTINKFKKANQKGLVITSYSFPTEYEKIIGFNISFINTQKTKTIKYISFTLVAYNPVNDKVGSKMVRGIGPVKYNESGGYEFESVFYSNIIDKIRISSITIEYTDGTKKYFSNFQEVNELLIVNE